MNNNLIYSINGPVVTVKDSKDFSMQEMVFVGNKEMMGEVIGIDEQYTTIQVYESTTGLKPGEPVRPSGSLSVSYTHLDVYKRQLRRIGAIRKARSMIRIRNSGKLNRSCRGSAICRH